MLFLPTVNDKLQVITSAAGQVDVHASYVDLAGTTVTPGRLNTRISTAATTDVVAAPGASTTRNIKSLKVGNNHATVTNTVTMQMTDGTNVIVIEQVTLQPGERIGYEESVGIRYFDSLGREKIGSGPGLPGGGNTADVVASAADTYLTGSAENITNRLQAGCGFEYVFRVTKTAAGVATPTFIIRTGTTGTTADTARVTFTGAAQTAVVDTGWVNIEAHFRSVGAATVIDAYIRLDHTSADGAGLGTFRYTQVTSASFDSTPLGTILGISCNPGASGVWTFQLVRHLAYGLTN